MNGIGGFGLESRRRVGLGVRFVALLAFVACNDKRPSADHGDATPLPNEESDTPAEVAPPDVPPTDIADLDVSVPDVVVPDLVAPYCGDGEVTGGEECDDGNNEWGDGCSEDCLEEMCGNGTTEPERGEDCDDGNDVPYDGCHECRGSRCGNGILDDGEECDDGNRWLFDGCDSNCARDECLPVLSSLASRGGGVALGETGTVLIRYPQPGQSVLLAQRDGERWHLQEASTDTSEVEESQLFYEELLLWDDVSQSVYSLPVGDLAHQASPFRLRFTGALWKYERVTVGPRDPLAGTPTGYAWDPKQRRLFALNPATGLEVWYLEGTEWRPEVVEVDVPPAWIFWDREDERLYALSSGEGESGPSLLSLRIDGAVDVRTETLEYEPNPLPRRSSQFTSTGDSSAAVFTLLDARAETRGVLSLRERPDGSFVFLLSRHPQRPGRNLVWEPTTDTLLAIVGGHGRYRVAPYTRDEEEGWVTQVDPVERAAPLTFYDSVLSEDGTSIVVYGDRDLSEFSEVDGWRSLSIEFVEEEPVEFAGQHHWLTGDPNGGELFVGNFLGTPTRETGSLHGPWHLVRTGDTWHASLLPPIPDWDEDSAAQALWDSSSRRLVVLNDVGEAWTVQNVADVWSDWRTFESDGERPTSVADVVWDRETRTGYTYGVDPGGAGQIHSLRVRTDGTWRWDELATAGALGDGSLALDYLSRRLVIVGTDESGATVAIGYDFATGALTMSPVRGGPEARPRADGLELTFTGRPGAYYLWQQHSSTWNAELETMQASDDGFELESCRIGGI